MAADDLSAAVLAAINAGKSEQAIDAFVTAAQVFEQTGQFQSLLALVRDAGPHLESPPPGYLELHEGIALFGLKEPEKAIAVLTQALSKSTDDNVTARALLHKGYALQVLKQHPEAVATLSRVLEMNVMPEWRDAARMNIASSSLALGDAQAVLKTVDALEAVDKLPPPIVETFCGILGKIGQPEAVLQRLAMFTAMHPTEYTPWLHVAGAHLALAQWKESIAAVDEALRLAGSKKTAQMLCMKGAALRMLGDFENALKALDDAASLDSAVLKDINYLDLTFLVLTRLHQTDRAAELVRNALEDPALANSTQLAYLHIDSLHRSGQTELASTKMQALADSETSEPGAMPWLIRAGFRLALGRPDGAADALERARKADPAVVQQLFYVMLYAPILMSRDRHAEAVAFIDAQKPDPVKTPFLRLIRANALAQSEKSAEALKECAAILGVSKGHPLEDMLNYGALTLRGWIETQNKSWDSAAASFAEAAKAAQGAGDTLNVVLAMVGQSLVRLGRSLDESGDAARQQRVEALQILDSATKLSEKTVFPFIGALAHWCRGIVLTASEQDEKALAAFRAADAVANVPMVKLSLGGAYVRLEDHNLALKAYTAATTIASSVKERAEAWRGKATALFHLGQFEHCLEACRTAIEVEGETESNLEIMGVTYAALGRSEPALRTFRRGWASGTHGHRSVKIAVGLSAELLSMARNAEAADFLKQAEVDTKPNGSFYLNLAAALMRTQDQHGATRALEEARRLGDPRAHDAIKRLKDAAAAGHTWVGFWFGSSRFVHNMLGGILLFLLLIALVPSLLTAEVAAEAFPWVRMDKEWQVMLIPIALLAVLLTLPNLKGFKFAGVEIDVAQPKPQIERPDMNEMLAVARMSISSQSISLSRATVTGATAPGTKGIG